MNKISDANSLYDAYKRSMKNSAWKTEAQEYEIDWLSNISQAQKSIIEETYSTELCTHFKLSERGKTRAIIGNKINDRIIRHAICDEVLSQSVKPYLIYDNGASQQGKGVDFSLQRLHCHLQRYYRKYGNQGYVLLIDFSKYYDNIHHDISLQQLNEIIKDSETNYLLSRVFDNFKVDVSYLSDQEYEKCLDKKFEMINYFNIKKILKTGTKYMYKSVYIGDQVSQTIGVYYPHLMDNYCKIVRGMKYYGRYMDDTYIISNSKAELQELLKEINEITSKLGLFINLKKTQIFRIDKGFKFLQHYFTLSKSGRVIERISK